MTRHGDNLLTGELISCEVVGTTGDGSRKIWKRVTDAYECFTYHRGSFMPYEPSSLDVMGDLYGTYIDENGERVEF